MPLTPGSSREVIGQNIKEMEASGHPRRQAIAAALSNARKHSEGGTAQAPQGLKKDRNAMANGKCSMPGKKIDDQMRMKSHGKGLNTRTQTPEKFAAQSERKIEMEMRSCKKK